MSTNSVEEVPREISISQLVQWVASATAKTKDFILKPDDLRTLYLLVVWRHISKLNADTTDIAADAPKIASDSEITIPEDELKKMVQMLFHNTYYPYIHRVTHM